MPVRAVRGSIVSDTSTSPEAVEETAPGTTVPETAVPISEPPVNEAPVKRTRAKKTVVAVPASDETVATEDAPVETVPATTDAAPDTVPESEVVETPASPTHQVVYVEAPKPFLAKGNRGFGVLIAILSTVIFAAVYAGILVLIELANGGTIDVSYLAQGDFWAPVGAFLIGFIVLVLILNRAGWAAHVLGSLIVGVFVYFVSAGVILLFHLSQIQANQGGAAYKDALLSIGTIVAALLAREVALWAGFAVAARGRRVKARNVEARAVYDQEIADKKAEYESGVARAS